MNRFSSWLDEVQEPLSSSREVWAATLARGLNPRHASDRRSQSVLAAALRGYGATWVYYVILSLVFASICNGLWGVPLWQVVDVNLSLFLTWVAFMAALGVFAFAVDLSQGDLSSALANILFIVLLALLPFGVITGYMIYAWLGGGQVTNASFVYDAFLNLFVQGYQYLAGLFGDVLGLIATTESNGVVKPSVNVPGLQIWIQVITAGIAAADIFYRYWSRRQTAAA